ARERAQEGGEVRFLLIAEAQRPELEVPVDRRAPALVVEIDHRLERARAPVVEVRTGRGDVAERRSLERAPEPAPPRHAFATVVGAVGLGRDVKALVGEVGPRVAGHAASFPGEEPEPADLAVPEAASALEPDLVARLSRQDRALEA